MLKETEKKNYIDERNACILKDTLLENSIIFFAFLLINFSLFYNCIFSECLIFLTEGVNYHQTISKSYNKVSQPDPLYPNKIQISVE